MLEQDEQRVTGAEWRLLFDALPAIQELEINGPIEANDTEEISRVTTIKVLLLDGRFMDVESLSPLKKMQQLTSLTIRYAPRWKPDDLLTLSEFRELKTLMFQSTHLFSPALKKGA